MFGAAVVIAALAVVAAVLPMVASSASGDVRDIDVVVREMAFYVDNGADPNPVITLQAGQRVRLHVRNEDAGMRHDFTIKAWTVSTKMLEERGQQDTIEFVVPDERGTQTYQCTPHAKMMTGAVRVE
jgi:plastocyanin